MNKKKFLNDPNDIAGELLEGLYYSNKDRLVVQLCINQLFSDILAFGFSENHESGI